MEIKLDDMSLQTKLCTLLLFIGFLSCSRNEKPESMDFRKYKKPKSIDFKKLQVIDSTNEHVLFKGKISINGVSFDVINEVIYDEVGERLTLIHQKDTLKVVFDASYLNNFLFDVNSDKEPELNFMYRMSNHSFVNYSFRYDISTKFYRQIPDTLYYKDLEFLQ